MDAADEIPLDLPGASTVSLFSAQKAQQQRGPSALKTAHDFSL